MPAYDSTNSFHNPHVAVDSEPSVAWQTAIDSHRGDLFFGNDRLYIDSGRNLSIVDVSAEEAVSGRVPMRLLTVWNDVLYYRSLEEADEQGTVAVQTDDVLTWSAGTGERTEQETPASTAGGNPTIMWQDGRILQHGKRAGGGYYGLTDDEEFVALDATDGDQRWSSELPIEVRDFVVTDTHVILYNNEQISALDIESGEERWRQTPNPEQVLGSVELDQAFEDMIDDPTDVSLAFGSVRVSDGVLLVFEAAPRFGLRVVSGRNLATGEPTWFRQNAGLVGVTENQFFSAFGTWDTGNGDSRWHVGSEPPFGTSAPLPVIATQDHILVGGGHSDDPDRGRLVAFHQSDGSQSWSLDFDARIWQCIAVKETIFATTTAGTLLALS